MTPELWNRLKPLFQAVVEKPEAERTAFIATIDAEEELRRELLALVRAFEATGSTLDALATGLQSMVPGACSGLNSGDVLLGRFRIARWLGSGGMGDVYEAFDLELGESVALKTIRPGLTGNTDVLARLKKEVYIARHLTAPNLCRIHELFVAGEDRTGQPCVFITMELLEGVTLADEIKKRGFLPWSNVREIANEICSALQSMHEAGIIHRDVKSRNIMLVKRNNAVRTVLMDFGLAREVASPRLDAETPLSMPGGPVGTPANMAPEQFSGDPLTPATDIYAAGVVLYEMLTGKAPYPANDPLRAAIMRGKLPIPVSRVRRGIPHSLDGVVAKCFEFEPRRRYQSAAELARDLRRSSKPLRMLVERGSSSPFKWIFAALAVLALAAVTAMWWKPGKAPFPPDPRAVPWYQQGLAALREGSYLQAARELEQAVKLDYRFVAAHARLAEAWAELDDNGAAEHELLVALQQSRERPLAPLDRKYLEATQASLAHDFAGAVRQQESILQLLPEDEKGFGYVDLGRAQEKNSNIGAAVNSYQAAANLRPNNPAAFVHLGILKSRLQDSAGAEAAFGQAENQYTLKQNIEGLAEVYFHRARWANQRADPAEAEMWLNKCMQIARQIPSVQLEIRTLVELSNVEYDSNRDDKSIEDAGRAVQLARENNLDYWVADGLIRQASAFLDKHELAEAEALTRQALKLAEQREFEHLTANAQFTLSSIRDQQGKRTEQIEYARAALSFYSKSEFRSQAAGTEELLVRAQIAMGDLSEAYQSATLLLRDSEKLGSPAPLEAAEMTMGEVLMEMERYPEALEHLQKALQLSEKTQQDTPYYLLNCADALWRIGRYDDADAMLNSITEQLHVPANIAVGIARSRASIRLTQRNFKEAASISNKALRQFKDLASDEVMDFGSISIIADLETGRRPEAQLESRKLADVARGEKNDKFIARSNYLLAMVDLKTGSPARAGEEAQAAQAYFAAKNLLDSEWMSLVCLARTGMALGDRAMAKKNAGKALDTLQSLLQSWDARSRQYFNARPDTRFAAAEMSSVIGAK